MKLKHTSNRPRLQENGTMIAAAFRVMPSWQA